MHHYARDQMAYFFFSYSILLCKEIVILESLQMGNTLLKQLCPEVLTGEHTPLLQSCSFTHFIVKECKVFPGLVQKHTVKVLKGKAVQQILSVMAFLSKSTCTSLSLDFPYIQIGQHMLTSSSSSTSDLASSSRSSRSCRK